MQSFTARTEGQRLSVDVWADEGTHLTRSHVCVEQIQYRPRQAEVVFEHVRG